MISFFKKKEKEDEKEFTFIWYKKVETNKTTHYTAPFRTKVKAKNYFEAKEKVIDFAMSKTKLIVMDEDEYSKSKLHNFDKNIKEYFDKVNRLMNSLFSDVKMK